MCEFVYVKNESVCVCKCVIILKHLTDNFLNECKFTNTDICTLSSFDFSRHVHLYEYYLIKGLIFVAAFMHLYQHSVRLVCQTLTFVYSNYIIDNCVTVWSHILQLWVVCHLRNE